MASGTEPTSEQLRRINTEARTRARGSDPFARRNAGPFGSGGAEFGARNELRNEQGLAPEAPSGRGSRPPAWWLAALAPFVVPALAGGGAAGGAAGSAGAAGAGSAGAVGAGAAGTAGALAPVAAPSLLGQAGGFLAKNWKPILGAAQGVTGILQQRRASDAFDDAVARDTGRWDAQQPLRDAGMERLLNPVPVDTGNLATLGARGNPFAIPPAPMPAPGPAMPPVPARRLPPVRG